MHLFSKSHATFVISLLFIITKSKCTINNCTITNYKCSRTYIKNRSVKFKDANHVFFYANIIHQQLK